MVESDSAISNHQRCSFKKAVPKNSAIFTGKHLCWSLFFNKIAGLQTLLKGGCNKGGFL